MSEYLKEIICGQCGYIHYFESDNLPGGKEHCEYCEYCGTSLLKINKFKPIEQYKESPNGCLKCKILFELYEHTPETKRDYWLMTELFVMLHGTDECNYKSIRKCTCDRCLGLEQVI